MTRSPRGDFLLAVFCLSPPLRSALGGARLATGARPRSGSGLTLSCGGRAAAQNAAKGSADHIKAVTSAVDGASIKANARDIERLRRPSASTTPKPASASSTRSTPTTSRQLGLVWSYPLEILPRRRGDASRGRRHHVRQTASWSVRARHRRPHRLKGGCTYDPKWAREWGRYACCEPGQPGRGPPGRARSSSPPSTVADRTGCAVPARRYGSTQTSSRRPSPIPSPARRGCSTARC